MITLDERRLYFPEEFWDDPLVVSKYTPEDWDDDFGEEDSDDDDLSDEQYEIDLGDVDPIEDDSLEFEIAETFGIVREKGRRTEQRFDHVSEFYRLVYKPLELQRRISQRPPNYSDLNVDFQQSRVLAERGWPEGVSRVERFIHRLNTVLEARVAIPEVVYDVVGDNLDMGRFVAGEPEDFMSIVDSAIEFNVKPPKLVTIVATIDITRSPDAAIMRGAAVVALSQMLQRHGLRVRLLAHCGSNDLVDTWIQVKDYQWQSNIEDLVFLFAHPVVFYRLVMSAWEHLPTELRNRMGGLGVQSWGYISQPPHDERGDIYIPATGANWIRDEESTIAWICSQLEKFGIRTEVI